MAKKLDAARIAEKQTRRAQSATTDYQAGVAAVTESPMQKAKAKKEKMRQGINAALDSGKWEAGLDSVTLEDWKAAAQQKGGERYAGGVAAAQDKVKAFWDEYAPFLERVKAEIDRMPDTTAEQRMAKMVADAKAIAQFKRTRRRR